MDDMKREVQENYGAVARAGGGLEAGINPETAGYAAEDLAAAPEGSNMGLGCGNPLALADLKPGETVLDLGSGGGFDCFLAAKAVGPEGHVIGLDMTEDMVALAKRNAQKGGFDNVEFRLGEIEAMPVEDSTVDLIISNCVINLVPDKQKAFAEAFRVLKPGGRLHVSDIVLTKDVLPETLETVRAYVSCVAGAVSRETYLREMQEAGFVNATIHSETDASLLLGSACCCAPEEEEEESCCCGGSEEADSCGDSCSDSCADSRGGFLRELSGGVAVSITVSAHKPQRTHD
jgi:arsenite methyltransferase